MVPFNTASASVQFVVVSLLIDRRVQTPLAIALALLASVVLGGDVPETKRSVISDGIHRR